MTHPSVPIKTKICGLSTAETMAAALDAGADYVGLVFFPKSPRNVTFEQAGALAGQARGRSRVVALVVDPDPALVSTIAIDLRPDAIQLHGHETPDDVGRLRERLTAWGRADCAIWKAVSISAAADVEAAMIYHGVADLMLFDAKAPKGSALPGGNGLTFDWRLLAGIAGRFPFMLSGGLHPGNVAEAIGITGAWGVDVSSGVESAPGIKDCELIRRFLQTVNGSTTSS